jgi:hypothetical protein
MILWEKQLFRKTFFLKKNVLGKLDSNFKIKKTIILNKKIKILKDKTFLNNLDFKFSFVFSLSKIYLEKKYKKKNSFENLLSKKYSKNKINISPELNHVVKNNKISSLESCHIAKINEMLFVNKESRIEIDDLIKKKIKKIIELKFNKNQGFENPIMSKKTGSNNGKIILNNNLSVPNKDFNRKLLTNINRILELTESIFI